MSKAFVKEPDNEIDLPYEPPAIPAGIKNYMTPQGHRHMRDELHHLLRMERPKVVETVAWAAGNGDRSENGDYIYGTLSGGLTERAPALACAALAAVTALAEPPR